MPRTEKAVLSVVPTSKAVYPTSSAMEASAMSTYDLISNPGTLKGGMGLFRQRIDNKIDVHEFKKRLGAESCSTKSKDENQAPRTRSRSKTALSNSSEGSDRSDRKAKKQKTSKSGKSSCVSVSVDEPDNDKKRVKKTDSQSSLLSISQSPRRTRSMASELSESQSQKDVDDSQLLEEDDIGEAQFGELFKRFVEPDLPGKCYEDKFDLVNRGQLMRSVFEDYDEKEKFYNMHARKVRDLSSHQFDKQFRKVKGAILDIFEGRLETTRMELYCSQARNDRQRLIGLNVADPFTSLQGAELASNLFEYLVPDPKSRMKFNNFIKLVMLPEALIRIYANVNHIDMQMAEKEMKWGPRYDGPLPTEWYPESDTNPGEITMKT